jgi:hypothetical protein
MPDQDLLATCWTTAGDAAPLRGDERSPLPLRERVEAPAAAFATARAQLELAGDGR